MQKSLVAQTLATRWLIKIILIKQDSSMVDGKLG